MMNEEARTPPHSSFIIPHSSLPSVSWAAQGAARVHVGAASAVDLHPPVDEDVINPFGVAVRFVEGREVAHARRVEDGHVGVRARAQHAAAREPYARGGLRGHL